MMQILPGDTAVLEWWPRAGSRFLLPPGRPAYPGLPGQGERVIPTVGPRDASEAWHSLSRVSSRNLPFPEHRLAWFELPFSCRASLIQIEFFHQRRERAPRRESTAPRS